MPGRRPRQRTVPTPMILLLVLGLGLTTLAPGGRLNGPVTTSISRHCLDPASRNAIPPAPEETPSEEEGERIEIACETSSRRNGGAIPPRAPDPDRSRTIPAPAGRHFPGRDHGPGHFLATGRALRQWLQSPLC